MGQSRQDTDGTQQMGQVQQDTVNRITTQQDTVSGTITLGNQDTVDREIYITTH